MIPCLSFFIPTIVIGWSHKYKEILSEFQLDDLMIESSKINLNKFLALFNFATENHASIYSKLENNLPKQMNQAYKQFID